MVAVTIVRVMEMPVHEVVDVVPVRHCFMAATWPVLVLRLVCEAGVPGRAAARIQHIHGDHVLIDVPGVRVVSSYWRQ